MRALKVLVAVMGVMLVAGLAVVIGTIIHRATQRQAASSAFAHSALILPQGARVVEMRGVGDRLALRVERADGSEMLIIVDPATGTAIGTIDLKPGN